LDKIFIDQGRKLPKESFELSGLMSGNADALHWSSQERAVDFFDVKGVCESILESCNVYEYSVEESKLPFYLPGHAVDIFVKKQKIGNCGKLDAKIAEEFEIEQPLFVFNIYLDELLSAPREKVPHFTPISKYPTVERDISFVVSKDVAYQNMVEVIQKAEKKNIKKISLIDEYTGKGVSEGFRSLTFKLDLGADTKTLTDNEINRIVNTVIEKLKNKFEIVLR
jgi:phenylalanyl-tRNA synthetase beta chain